MESDRSSAPQQQSLASFSLSSKLIGEGGNGDVFGLYSVQEVSRFLANVIDEVHTDGVELPHDLYYVLKLSRSIIQGDPSPYLERIREAVHIKLMMDRHSTAFIRTRRWGVIHMPSLRRQSASPSPVKIFEIMEYGGEDVHTLLHRHKITSVDIYNCWSSMVEILRHGSEIIAMGRWIMDVKMENMVYDREKGQLRLIDVEMPMDHDMKRRILTPHIVSIPYQLLAIYDEGGQYHQKFHATEERYKALLPHQYINQKHHQQQYRMRKQHARQQQEKQRLARWIASLTLIYPLFVVMMIMINRAMLQMKSQQPHDALYRMIAIMNYVLIERSLPQYRFKEEFFPQLVDDMIKIYPGTKKPEISGV